MSDRYKAPRRAIESVTRSGAYGTTWWLHRLSCGHVERRKRKIDRPTIGCGRCIADERERVRSLLQLASLPDEGAVEAELDQEWAALQIAAEIAARLHISPDMVNVRLRAVGTGLEIEGVMVWVPGDVALAML